MSLNALHVSMSRRELLQRGLAGAAWLSLGGWSVASTPQAHAAPALSAGPARAKSVIQIWMWGGPSHLETFDPKPEAGTDYTGPMDAAIDTAVPGIRFSTLLPRLASHADKLAVIRSMTHGVNGHETAAYLMQTGRKPDRLVYPSLGAVVGLFRGYDHGYQGIVPPYIVLTQPQGRFSESGLLGQRYKPFCTGGDPAQQRFVVEGVIAEGISDERQQARRRLLHDLDTLGNAMPSEQAFEAFDRCGENAYDLMFGKARELFDLNRESPQLRDRYGRNTFGQSCLMARRLVEIGVPYITINYKGWDTHKQHFEIMRRRLPEMDQAMAALLEDLTERGLLDSTIVWWGGEFGRTPKVQWGAPWNGGRGHYGNCFSAVLAGGGFRGGVAVGSSDARGEEVVDRPVYPRDIIGAIYERMGIDPDGTLTNPGGLDLTVLPPAVAGQNSGGRLAEILPA